MPVCVEYAPPAMTKAQYDHIMQKLGEAGALGNPNGLAHVCHGREGRLRVMDIWKTEEAFHEFWRVLEPIIRDVMDDAATVHAVSPVVSLLLAAE